MSAPTKAAPAKKRAAKATPKLDLSWTAKPNLNGFDDFAKEIAGEALKLGWLSKVSSKGHLIMRAPDGQTTTSIVPKMNAPRIRDNARAPIKAYEKRAKLTLEQLEDGTFKCPTCGFVSDNRGTMLGHLVNQHSIVRVCAVCDRAFKTPASYGTHIKSHADILNPPEPEPTPEPEPEIAPEPAVTLKAVPEIEETEVVEEAKPAVDGDGHVTVTATGPGHAPIQVIDQHAFNTDGMTTEQLLAKGRDFLSVFEAILQRLSDAEARLKLIQEATRM